MSSKLRNANPCDGCALRRVKCEDSRPCRECRLRGIECTVLRARKKRGPKGGPRIATRARVEEFQRSIKDSESHSADTIDGSAESSRSLSETPSLQSNPQPPYRLPLADYKRFLGVFKQNSYSIWPVVDCDKILSDIAENDQDHEAHALAASLCAATIAQLRLSEHTNQRNTLSSLQFATDCLQSREQYDYRETFSIASVLIPFFLHVYYANADKLRTAGLFLREAVTENGHFGFAFIGFFLISERTYSAQHGLPAVLRAIDVMPYLDNDMGDEHLMQSFISLARLFAYLEGNLAVPSYGQEPLERQKLVSYHADLCMDSHDQAAHEAQRVDLFVTRQWIRLLLWEYTAQHFIMSCYPEDQAFSLFLPVKIGHEMLSLFSMVTSAAIKAHGYGMELKVFRLADAMLDIVACTPFSARGNSMLVGSGDVLATLSRVLLAVGGRESRFLHRMHERMSQLEVGNSQWPYAAISESKDEEDDGRVVDVS
ncbi:hypothetical protein CEP52_011024 [Fusarium oligoseptatum]|uniref:Zn(2)-C6 fungal-type domain-containing protein n=1 Tax=Fusarium oligoseptatum TaxID=2604345 RepID=A0A428T5F0_9HYPO|nr:hypothetical protein CEP52_011024 [Fusarium oligoseptatum]